MPALTATELQQQLAFEAALRPGQRVQATAPMEEGGTICFTAVVVRILDEAVVVTAVEPHRLLAEAPQEYIIPRFSQPSWSPDHRVQALPWHPASTRS